MEKEKEVGKITHYYDHLQVAVVSLSDSLKVGDKVHIVGHSEDFSQTITSIQADHKNIEVAKAKEEIGLKVDQKVHENSKVYKIL